MCLLVEENKQIHVKTLSKHVHDGVTFGTCISHIRKFSSSLVDFARSGDDDDDVLPSLPWKMSSWSGDEFQLSIWEFLLSFFLCCSSRAHTDVFKYVYAYRMCIYEFSVVKREKRREKCMKNGMNGMIDVKKMCETKESEKKKMKKKKK